MAALSSSSEIDSTAAPRTLRGSVGATWMAGTIVPKTKPIVTPVSSKLDQLRRAI